jgi:hypothetical protein
MSPRPARHPLEQGSHAQPAAATGALPAATAGGDRRDASFHDRSLLLHVFERVAAEGRPHLLVVASADSGASRLVGELVLALGDRATVLTAQCRGATGRPSSPLARIVGQAAGSAPGDPVTASDCRLTGLLAGDACPEPEPIALLVHQLLRAVGGEAPVVMVVEDVHRAEPALADMLAGLLDCAHSSPLLLVCTARAGASAAVRRLGRGPRASTLLLPPRPRAAAPLASPSTEPVGAQTKAGATPAPGLRVGELAGARP